MSIRNMTRARLPLAVVLLLLIGLSGCFGRSRKVARTDPATLALAAWERQVPFALKAAYSMTVDAPRMGIEGTTRGGLLVHRPGRFRVEVFAPFGTPLMYAVSDGSDLNFYVTTEKTFYGAKDAEEVLRNVTGGAAGLEDLVAMMTGRLPFEQAEVTSFSQDGGETTFVFSGPKDTRAEVVLEDRTLTMKRVRAFDRAGQVVLIADYKDYMAVGRSRLPEEIELQVPLLDFRLELDFSGWQELGRIPDAFTFPPPGGSTVVDLQQTLEEVQRQMTTTEPVGEFTIPSLMPDAKVTPEEPLTPPAIEDAVIKDLEVPPQDPVEAQPDPE